MADADDASAFSKLDQRAHVLARPGMYVGSTEPCETTAWVLSDDDPPSRVVERAVTVAPALYKIFDEILVNALDHATRLKAARGRAEDGDADVRPVKKVSVSLSDDGVISVANDGEGLPVVVHPEHGCYVPELVFGHMLTSANYAVHADGRTVGGMNGIGAKAASIFSSSFEVETVDRGRRLRYAQRFEANMSVAHPPTISPCSKAPGTTVRFRPDYARLGCPDGSLPADARALFVRRAYDAAATSGLAVEVDGVRVPVRDLASYARMFVGPDRAIVHERIDERWEVVFALSDGGGLRHVSWVNGVATPRGGRHVDHVVGSVVKRVVEALKAKGGKRARGGRGSNNNNKEQQPGGAVQPRFVRDGLFVMVNAVVPDPEFDGQTKETLTTPPARFGSRAEPSDALVRKVLALEGLVERVEALSGAVADRALARSDGSKRACVTGVPKLSDANWAGGARSARCTLVLSEGDSARATAIAGIVAAPGAHDAWGAFPLKGKPLNPNDLPAERVAANEEISSIKKILGLQSGREYADAGELRYGRVMVLADQDLDGSHIRGLVMNLFFRLWPSLLKIDGFLVTMLTPIVRVSRQGGGVRSLEDARSFYGLRDLEEWRRGPEAAEWGGWTSKYYKGLGTSTSAEAKGYFRDPKVVTYRWEEEPSSAAALDLLFDKTRADARKDWLRAYDAGRTLDYGGSRVVGYREFADADMIHFSVADVRRSIPSVVDGLKPSQRKVLFAAFKRNLVQELRVAQFAGYVSEVAAYHHGEASLVGTIVGMAQDFVGANNLPLLQPRGQFGTALQGGKDHASARYISTMLSPLARALFPREDDAVLKPLDDDGVPIEPEHYVPVIPLVLVNGAFGVGTGYSTTVPCHSPLDVLSSVRALLDAHDSGLDVATVELPEVAPWYAGFRGAVERGADGRWWTRGTATASGAASVEVSCLPVGTWFDDFKAALEAWIAKTPDARGYADHSTDVDARFAIRFASGAARDAWLAPAATGPGAVTRLEADLKLVSGKGLTTTNMHLFDAGGRIERYGTTADILRAHFAARLDAYVRRKAAVIAGLERDVVVLEGKTRFLGAVVSGELRLDRFETGGALDAELARIGVPPLVEGFRYVTSMPMSSMTADRLRTLDAQLVRARAAIGELAARGPTDMWRADLAAFERAYSTRRQDAGASDDDDRA